MSGTHINVGLSNVWLFGSEDLALRDVSLLRIIPECYREWQFLRIVAKIFVKIVSIRARFLLSTFRKITVFIVAVGLVALVVSAGSWASREISKREFETEARNVVSVLRSGVSVVDGLLTSLDASDYTARGTSQLDSHLATVLAKYEYITGLGRFEKVEGLRPAKYPLSIARFRSTQDLSLIHI